MAELAVSAVGTLVSAVIRALEDVKVNKQTCKLLAEQWRRLQVRTLPKLQTASAPSVGKRVKLHSLIHYPELNGVEGEILEFNESTGRWKVQLHTDGSVLALQASNLAVNLEQSHDSALQALDLLGNETTAFIEKFNDRGFITKHWNHALDKEKFCELGTRLDNLFQELQLGILTDIKEDIQEDRRVFLQKLDRLHDLDFEDVKKQLDHLVELGLEQLQGVQDLHRKIDALKVNQPVFTLELKGICSRCGYPVNNLQERGRDEYGYYHVTCDGVAAAAAGNAAAHRVPGPVQPRRGCV